MNPPRSIWARLALWPLSLLYRGATAAHRTAYRGGWLAVERAPIPVVSVGNLSVGGTGKTPLVAKICRLLDDAGLKTAVVSRGYGRRRNDGVTVVSRGDGHGPVVDVLSAGDEPFLLASRLPRSAVVVAPRRIEGARLAAAELGAEVVVADDAYQHHGLARDLDLLVIDATEPTDSGWLLPAGALREPLSSAARAGAFLLSRSDRSDRNQDTEDVFRRYNPGAAFFHTASRCAGLILPDGQEVAPSALAGRSVLGFCGIAKPLPFREDLGRLGLEVAGFTAFPDYHWFDDNDLEGLSRQAAAAGASMWITTEKDFVRLTEEQRSAYPVGQVRVEVEIRDEERFRALLLQSLPTEAAA